MKRLHNRALTKKLMKDPKFKAEYDALEPEFVLLEKMLQDKKHISVNLRNTKNKNRDSSCNWI